MNNLETKLTSRFWPMVGLFMLLHMSLFLIFRELHYADHPFSGFDVFYSYSSQMNAGQLPYADFTVEYPPIALIFTYIPGIFAHTRAAYVDAFLLEMLIFDLLAVVLVALYARKLDLPLVKTLGIFSIALAAIGPTITMRYDLIAGFLVALSLYAFVRGKYALSWGILAVSVMTKVFPLALGPLYLLWHWRHRQIRQAAAGLGIFGFVFLLIAAAPLAMNSGNFMDSFIYHLDRPLQVESLYSSAIFVGHLLGVGNFDFVASFGSLNITSPLADSLASASIWITAAALLTIYFLFFQVIRRMGTATGRAEPPAALSQVAVIFGAAAILTFMVLSKVLSPQYIIWLYPLIPLVQRSGRLPWLLFVAVSAITIFIYPNNYDGIGAQTPLVVWLLFLRNIILLTMVPVMLKGAVLLTTGDRATAPEQG